MYEILKNIATTNEWVFSYARKDFANLYSEIVKPLVPHIFLDPITIDTTFGEQGEEETKTYTGSFMMLVSSDIDEEDYDTRYQTYIKPLLDEASVTLKDGIQCDGTLTILNWREIEIINVLDYNLDGIVVTYTVIGG